MTLAEIMFNLRTHDGEIDQWGERPSIYVAAPQTSQSEGSVEYSMSRGGLPEIAGRRLFYYLTSVRRALELPSDDYDRLRADARIDSMFVKILSANQSLNGDVASHAS